jgi:hypothetical protein
MIFDIYTIVNALNKMLGTTPFAEAGPGLPGPSSGRRDGSARYRPSIDIADGSPQDLALD